MTCKNCGADVDAEALECPYCGTKNPGGISFFVRLKYKRAQNQELRKKVLDRSKEGIINRIMNRTIFALVIVFILMVGISFWTFFFTEGNHLFKPSDREQVMQELYENGEYDRLNTYMQEYDLYDEKYRRISFLAFDYAQFLSARDDILEQIKEGEMPEDYSIESTIERGYRVLYPSYSGYESEETDRKYSEECGIIVRDSLQVLFGFGEGELELLKKNHEEYTYLDYDVRDELLAVATEHLEKGGASK